MIKYTCHRCTAAQTMQLLKDSIIGGMEDDEYLVIACCSFNKGIEKRNPHITVKKIPQMLLSRCEFDKADYSLNIIHPPVYEDEECEDEQ